MSDTFAVRLRELKKHVTIPSDLVTGLQLLPYVVVSGTHCTFLKEGATLGGREARKKDAPHTTFVRALRIKKSLIAEPECEILDQGIVIVHTYLYLNSVDCSL